LHIKRVYRRKSKFYLYNTFTLIVLTLLGVDLNNLEAENELTY
jgi:hypothetical protein